MVAGVAGCHGLAPAKGMEVEVMAHCSGFEGRKGDVGCWRWEVVGDQCGRRVGVAAGQACLCRRLPSDWVTAWETRRRISPVVAGWSCTWWQPSASR